MLFSRCAVPLLAAVTILGNSVNSFRIAKALRVGEAASASGGKDADSSTPLSIARNKYALRSGEKSFKKCLNPEDQEHFEDLTKNIQYEFNLAADMLEIGDVVAMSNRSDWTLTMKKHNVRYLCRLLLMSISVKSITLSYEEANAVCHLSKKSRNYPFEVLFQHGRWQGTPVSRLRSLFVSLQSFPRSDEKALVARGFNISGWLDRKAFKRSLPGKLYNSDKPTAVFLLGPSASGKSYMASQKKLVKQDIVLLIDGDVVREASAEVRWLQEDAWGRAKKQTGFNTSCPYMGYDIWNMLGGTKGALAHKWKKDLLGIFKDTQKHVTSSCVKKALTKFYIEAKMNLLIPETATGYGAALEAMPASLAPSGLNTKINMLKQDHGYNVQLHAVVAPMATTKCAAWRRAKTSWKPYSDSGWMPAVRVVQELFTTRPDVAFGGHVYIPFISKFSLTDGKTNLPPIPLTDDNWRTCVEAESVEYETLEFDWEWAPKDRLPTLRGLNMSTVRAFNTSKVQEKVRDA